MRFQLAGRWWRFEYHRKPKVGGVEKHGYCELKRRRLVVKSGLDDSYTLYLTVHELLHAVLWVAREKWVVDAAYSIRADLVRLGYSRSGNVQRGERALARKLDQLLGVQVPWMDPESRREVSADLARALKLLGWHRTRKVAA
jgi:hypothetical protein